MRHPPHMSLQYVTDSDRALLFNEGALLRLLAVHLRLRRGLGGGFDYRARRLVPLRRERRTLAWHSCELETDRLNLQDLDFLLGHDMLLRAPATAL